MKDSEFIELLNLYLDHEISVADAKRLEAEVQSSPDRHRVYREYCQMQKACVVWAEQSAAAASPTDAKVIPFESRRTSWGFGTYAAGVCAAAACVALALVIQSGNGSAGTAPKAIDPALIASVEIVAPIGSEDDVRSVVPSMLALSPRSTEFQPVMVAHNLALARQQREAGAVATTDARFDWMNRVQPTALQRSNAADLIFDIKPAQQPDVRAFRSRRSIDAQVEQAAFQFQR